VVNRLPLSGTAQTGAVEFEGRSGSYDTDWRSATPGYFEAIGIPLKQGRVFLDSDRAQSPAVGLIDERLARRVFGSESPIGKRFRRYLPGLSRQDPWAEIAGVVGHIQNDSLERDPRPQVYWPETQRTQDRAALVVRSVGHPESYTQAVVDQIRKEDAHQPVYDVRSMQEWLGRTLQTRTLLTGMVAMFAGASLLLACLGLYGVVSFTADLRLREFGIRMALGAGTGHVRGLVLRGIIAAKSAGIDRRGLHVDRNVEPARTRTSTLCKLPGALEVISDGKGIVDQHRVLGDLLDHGDDVGFLVSELAQASDALSAHAGFALDLAGDDEHRNGVGPGSENSVEGVDTAGPGGDVDHSGQAADAGVGFGGHR